MKISDNVLFHTLTRKWIFPARISEGLCLNRRWLMHGASAAHSGVFFHGHLVLGNVSCTPAFWEELGRQRCVALQTVHPSLLLPSCASMQKNIQSHFSRSSPCTFIILPLMTAFRGLAESGLRSQKGACQGTRASTRWLLDVIPDTFKTSLSITACGSPCTRILSRVSLRLVYLTPANTLPF